MPVSDCRQSRRRKRIFSAAFLIQITLKMLKFKHVRHFYDIIKS
jgi:hypothetical protein